MKCNIRIELIIEKKTSTTTNLNVSFIDFLILLNQKNFFV